MKKFFPTLRVMALSCLIPLLFQLHAKAGTGAKCEKPVNLSVSEISDSSVVVTWLGNSDAILYQIDVGSKEKTPKFDLQVSTSDTSLKITGLSPGGYYKFRVKATCMDGSSSGSSKWHDFMTSGQGNEKKNACMKPTNLALHEVTGQTAVLSWYGGADAVEFRLDVKSKEKTPKYKLETVTSDTSIMIDGLVPGGKYQWRVKSTCSNGASSGSSNWVVFVTSSEPGDSTGVCPPPASLMVSDITSTSALISWMSDPSATGYLLRVMNDPGTPDLNVEMELPGSPYVIEGLSPGGSYQVILKALCDSTEMSDEILLSFAADSGISDDACTIPDSLQVEAVDDSMSILSWVGPDSAGFQVEVESLDSAVIYNVDTIISLTELLLENLLAGVHYQFRVATICDTTAVSSFSEWQQFIGGVDSTSLDSCTVPHDLQVVATTDTSSVLSWSAPDSNSFQVVVEKVDTMMMILYDSIVSDTSLLVADLDSSATYRFQVRTICDSVITSEYSEWLEFIAGADSHTDTCETPSNLNALVLSDTSATLSWSGPDSAEFHLVVERHDSVNEVILDTVTVDTSFSIEHLDSATNYQFGVVSICDLLSMSPPSEYHQFSTLRDTMAPEACPVAELTVDSVTMTTGSLSWTAIGDSSQYEIEVENIGVTPPFSFVTVTADTVQSVAGLSPGGLYHARITTLCNDSTASEPSAWVEFETIADSLEVACPVPIDLYAISLSDTTTEIGWTGSPSVVQYEFEIQSLDTTNAFQFIITTSDTFEIIEGLEAGGLYQFKVTAFCLDESVSEDSEWFEFSVGVGDSLSVSANSIAPAFPNPVSNQLTLMVPEGGFGYLTLVQLSDLGGRIVHQESYEGLHEGDEITLETTSLREGYYQLRVRGPVRTHQQMIFVSR
ncbi:MAG: fibronectin type III domain-containing protein [Saprospiraceae bacterium]|nr:fibronectin type III domain-containing protein [Saprospiraceae bacterium]